MNSKPFVPTEEELEELGFKEIDSDYEDGSKLYGEYSFGQLRAMLSFGRYEECSFTFEVHKSSHFSFYPKSLEELRLLISMMRP